MAFQRLYFALFISPYLCGVCPAQAPNESVQWAAALISQAPAKHGGLALLELTAEIKPGWHVYAPTQLPGGPTALRIALDDNQVAEVAGAISGTTAETKHDTSFGLETRFYTHSFTLHVPVHLKQEPAGGRQLIPVSIRFQTCSDRECLPPRTVHLSVPIDALPAT